MISSRHGACPGKVTHIYLTPFISRRHPQVSIKENCPRNGRTYSILTSWWLMNGVSVDFDVAFLKIWLIVDLFSQFYAVYFIV